MSSDQAADTNKGGTMKSNAKMTKTSRYALKKSGMAGGIATEA
jgi:hypothetical protein